MSAQHPEKEKFSFEKMKHQEREKIKYTERGLGAAISVQKKTLGITKKVWPRHLTATATGEMKRKWCEKKVRRLDKEATTKNNEVIALLAKSGEAFVEEGELADEEQHKSGQI